MTSFISKYTIFSLQIKNNHNAYIFVGNSS